MIQEQAIRLRGEDIFRMRGQLELSRERFARLIGTSASSVVRWEQAKRPRPQGSALTLIHALQSALVVDSSLGDKLTAWQDSGGDTAMWARIFATATRKRA